MWGRWAGEDVGSISKNRSSHHKFKSPKQFRFIAYLKTSVMNGSKRMQTRLYLFIPFLKMKVKWVRQKIGRAENCIKETNRINIFATNCF